MTPRPPFVVSSSDVPESTHTYPQSTEPMGPTRSLGKAAGLMRIVGPQTEHMLDDGGAQGLRARHGAHQRHA